jgi:hypothetical protein
LLLIVVIRFNSPLARRISATPTLLHGFPAPNRFSLLTVMCLPVSIYFSMKVFPSMTLDLGGAACLLSQLTDELCVVSFECHGVVICEFRVFAEDPICCDLAAILEDGGKG